MHASLDILKNIKFSVLDLVPVAQGNSALNSFHNSLELAKHVESLGFERFWISEHHNMENIVSSATSILIGYVAQGTSQIRVGSGGIMLPNHAPLVVAEQFGTLATLYPRRIDLGLGRAPGTDQETAAALRRNRQESPQDFPNNVQELQKYLSEENKNASVRAIPGEGLNIPLYLLGSSTFSAQLAATLGLNYAFASHFAPAYLHQALQIYKENFKASNQQNKAYAIACVNVIAADTDEEAERMATTLKQFALGIIRGVRKPIPAPVASMDNIWNEAEKHAIQQMMHYTFIGSENTIRESLSRFAEETQVDEIMVVSHIHNHEERLRSYEILSRLFN
ncbi:LLM class flavin-dependent oxidoreductase [Gillisia sp. M10.2A]|uniref:LLM class flavin-dependent oxidoreductase n=1 Tax=Gillisia lutea TaxID=2909668 RepID=A0ABS9EFV7_9FLAO|nr:LLM class flavin-dependent oxidoreductase [Gillisia lutea]MCF4101726.1 LLM class flavin-dependent oxidoreductase [Gillisia lutea]